MREENNFTLFLRYRKKLNNMPRFLFILVLPLLFFSCKKDPNVLFEMNYPNNDFAIGAGLSPFEVHYFTLFNIQTGADSLFNFYNVDMSEVTQIQPRTARLSSIFASSDYNFINKIEIRIFEDDPDDYDVIFFRDDVPFDTRRDLDLVPNGVDVQNYLTGRRFGIVLRMELRDISPEFLESRLNFSFSVQ